MSPSSREHCQRCCEGKIKHSNNSECNASRTVIRQKKKTNCRKNKNKVINLTCPKSVQRCSTPIADLIFHKNKPL